jgi:hypothetical protein
MTDMGAGHAHGENVAEQESDADSIDQPSEACAHCMGHSQLPVSPALLREAGQTNRGSNLSLTLTPVELGSFAVAPARTVAAREHSPPGAKTPSRHVLVNVFRI